MILAQVEIACEDAYSACGDAVEGGLTSFDGVWVRRLVLVTGFSLKHRTKARHTCLGHVLNSGAGGIGLQRHVVSGGENYSRLRVVWPRPTRHGKTGNSLSD